jgi:hypothetical protein
MEHWYRMLRRDAKWRLLAASLEIAALYLNVDEIVIDLTNEL